MAINTTHRDLQVHARDARHAKDARDAKDAKDACHDALPSTSWSTVPAKFAVSYHGLNHLHAMPLVTMT